MRILLIGSGAREHAMAWKMLQSPLCKSLFVTPGNSGTARIAKNLNIQPTNFDGIAAAVKEHGINMIIVGPEEPLVKGLWDFFQNKPEFKDVTIIAPSAAAAALEGSKAVAKSFMQRYNIPTAAYREFTKDNLQEGIEYIRNHTLPVVLKADGLAAGKGVVICESHLEALAEFELMLLHSKFGDAGKRVVVEAFLKGIEMSFFAVTDGKNYVLLPEAKDYKRVGEGDKGLNTGGMGAVSPVPFLTEELKEKIVKKVVEPTIQNLQTEQLKYTGFLFFGLMIVDNEPYVIEYNCRMGDPETEAVLPRLKTDLVEILVAASNKTLDKINVEFDDRSSAVVVAVSGGYPGPHETGLQIHGLDSKFPENSLVFHAGAKSVGNDVFTNGGRVLAVCSLAPTMKEAVDDSIHALELIEFDGMYFRKDIGYEFNTNGNA